MNEQISRRIGARRAAALLAAAAVLALGLSAGARVRHLLVHLRSAQIGLAQLSTALTGGLESAGRVLQDPSQLATLRATTARLHGDLLDVQSLAHPFLGLTGYLGWLPRVGGDLKASGDLLEMAIQTSSMAMSLFDTLAPLSDLVSQETPGTRYLAPEACTRLLQAREQIGDSRKALEQAGRAREEIDALPLSPKLQETIVKFDRYAPSLALALDALEMLPGLLGAAKPMTYLVLAQNSDELRPTGGFISGVGTIQLSRGQVKSVSFQDSYAVDNLGVPHPDAPAPLRRYMGAGMLVLRDANWWPDFPTSAGTVAALYAQDTGQSVDGVLAVDVATLELLLGALGPISLPGYPDPIGIENLQSALRFYWQAPLVVAPGDTSEWWSHRKDFAGDLLGALLNKAVTEASPKQMVALGASMRTALTKRHIQVYVVDPGIAALLRRAGWDGAVRPGSGDFLMIVDSNVGFNKVNPNVEQTISYDVALDASGIALSEVTLTYHHLVDRPTPACIHEPRYGDSYADLMERCYWDYLRVYLPAGSEFVDMLGSDSLPEITDEGDNAVVGTFFVLEMGQSRTIRITYRHSLSPEDGEYRLRVRKQSGAQAHPLRVRVRLPKGATMLTATPEPIRLAGSLIWQGVLDQDTEIKVDWAESVKN